MAVFGAAFKPGSDDVRDSPALAVATALDQQGADVRIHDPQALDNARAAFPDLAYVPTVPDACENAELVLHLTAWPEYRQIDPAALALVVREPLLLDARNSLDEAVWQRAGWAIHGLGRPQTHRHGSTTADSSDRPVLVAGGAS